LVNGEGFQWLAIIIELGQNARVVAGDQWARRVAIVSNTWARLPFHHGTQVFFHNTALGG